MIKDLSTAVSSYIVALKYIFRLRYLKYLVLSGVLSFGIGSIIFGGIWKYSDNLGDWLSSFYVWEFGKSFINTLTDWAVWLILLIVAAMLFRYIVLLITAPILSMLSESLENEITNQQQAKLSIGAHLESYSRGIKISLRNITKEILLTLSFLILGIVTGLSFIVTPIIFLVQAYYAGFGNFDFLLERKFNVSSTVSFNKNQKLALITNGAIFLFILTIPVLGLFFAPALAVIAATIQGLKKL